MKRWLVGLLGPALEGFRWYRRWLGGHWELWYVDVVHAEVWHRVDRCSLRSGQRPSAICCGRPTCEDWPQTDGGALCSAS